MALRLDRAAWLGPRTEELGWLFARMESRIDFATVLDAQTPDQLTRAELDEVCRSPVQRVVVACENRWDLPVRQLEHLRTLWPEVPVALAISGWWEGAERTGAATAAVLRLPWYRWWDAWLPWLQGEASHWFGASPGVAYLQLAFAEAAGRLVDTPIDRAGDRTSVRAPNRGLNCVDDSEKRSAVASHAHAAIGCIVCDHVELAQAWRLAVGGSPTTLTLAEFQSIESVRDWSWILLDDALLNTVAHRRGDSQWPTLVREVRRGYPSSRIVCAMNQPQWSVWRAAMDAGADELLGKPVLGQGLRRALAEGTSVS